MKHISFSVRPVAVFLAVFMLGAFVNAQAATYYWKGATGDTAGDAWSNLSNWSTESATGADATALPGASDIFNGLENRSIDLEGQEWSIGGWDSTGNWTRYTMNLWNGTLNVVGNVQTHNDNIGIRADAKLVFASGATFTPAVWDGGSHNQYVHSDGELDILGNFNIYKYCLYVYPGGTAILNPTAWNISNNTAQESFLQNDGGTLSLPGGITFSSGSSDGNFSFSVNQNTGTLILGGPITKNGKAGVYNMSINGGIVQAAGSVSFNFDSATVPNGANVEFAIDTGTSIDLSGLTFGETSIITKTGTGDIAFTAGHMPGTLFVDEGAILLTAANTSYDLSDVTYSLNGKVKIGAPGITLTGWSSALISSTTRFVNGIASPVAGSTILTCSDASVLAVAKTGLDATLPDGFTTTINGNNLVVSSSYVFNSTTVTDLNDPAGWAGGSVPVGKVVTIMGAGVNPTTTALPAFAGITIQDGASLTISGSATLPNTTVDGASSLTIASGTVVQGGTLSLLSEAGGMPSLTIQSGATLEVPGGSVFTDGTLSIAGTLSATTAGDLTFGYAAAGDTASFGLTVNGGTIATTAGDLRFFCPASGGTVTPTAPVTFTGATFTHDNDHGFHFGVNNPTSTAISFTFDNTTLNYPKTGYYTIAGGSALSFVNGASLNRANSQNDRFTLTVSGLASIFLGAGTTSLIGESSSSGGSVGNGAMTFSPDTDGFVSLVVSNATWETYHSDGNNKAVAEIYGASTHTINQNNWNRTQPFHGFKAVHLNDDAVLSISNGSDATPIALSEVFTGTGSLVLMTPRVTSNTRAFAFQSTASTATGTLSLAPNLNTSLAIDPTATWAGTVVWNEKTSINHSANADAVTFGGIELEDDLTWRIWQGGVCDHYTLTEDGFIENAGGAVITIMDGSEAAPGDEWVLARVPADSYIPAIANTAWTLAAREVAGDATVVDLVLTASSSDYSFESTTVTDIMNGAGWSCGYVPDGQDVKITGAGVIAIVSDAATFPTFSSIAVRNGATLKVEAGVTLPPLTIDASSRVIIGNNSLQSAVGVTLNGTLVTAYDATVSPVALPIIEVATNATLTVAPGMKLKNVDFRLYGTVTKSDAADLTPIFGYAENGETSYLAMTVDGGVFDFHSNQSEPRGSVSIVCPAAGGTVIPVRTIVLRNAMRRVTGWADFGNWDFGVNNPTTTPFDVLIDGTHIECSSYLHVSGAANLTLVNGAHIQRQIDCVGHWFPMAIQNSATVTVGEGCYIDFTTGDGGFGIDNQSAVDSVTVRNGGIYTVSYNSSGYVTGVFVSNDGVLGVGKQYSTRVRSDLLRGFGAARLDGDLTIQSLNVGTGNTDWDRHVKMANVPFSGEGNIVVTNGVPAYPFSVTFVNGTSTATGMISVASVEGVDTALYFDNGANWAGTVVANGAVALTNSATAAAPTAVSFGGVRLDTASGLILRLWQDGTSDSIAVGDAGWTGEGSIDFELVGGFEPVGNESWKIGSVPSGAALPRARHSTYSLYRQASATAGLDDVYVKIPSGIVILLR